MVKIDYKGPASQGLQKPTKEETAAETQEHSKPSGKPTGCRVEDVLARWVIKELLLEEV